MSTTISLPGKLIYSDENADLFSISEDLVHVIYKCPVLDVKQAQPVVEQRITNCHNKPIALLADIAKVKTVSKEAREYLASRGTVLLTKNAIIISSEVNKVLANFYLRIDKPKTPTRFFTNSTDAIDWLFE